MSVGRRPRSVASPVPAPSQPSPSRIFRSFPVAGTQPLAAMYCAMYYCTYDVRSPSGSHHHLRNPAHRVGAGIAGKIACSAICRLLYAPLHRLLLYNMTCKGATVVSCRMLPYAAVCCRIPPPCAHRLRLAASAAVRLGSSGVRTASGGTDELVERTRHWEVHDPYGKVHRGMRGLLQC